jgi:hypothetical protein
VIGKKISYHTIFEDVGGGGMRVAYKAEDTQLRCFSWFKPSPKGIDIPTEGSLPANLNGGRPRILPAQCSRNPEWVEYLRSICLMIFHPFRVKGST